jgi:hypothetical protein
LLLLVFNAWVGSLILRFFLVGNTRGSVPDILRTTHLCSSTIFSIWFVGSIEDEKEWRLGCAKASGRREWTILYRSNGLKLDSLVAGVMRSC